MSKDKKAGKSKPQDSKLELIAGPSGAGAGKKNKKKGGKGKDGKDAKGGKDHAGPLDGLMKFAEHPLVADLLAVGALAAVAAIAEAGKGDPAAVKSSKAVKSAGKAAAAAIGARLLKEVTTGNGSGGNKKEA